MVQKILNTNLLRFFYLARHLTFQQIDSFNFFLSSDLKKIIYGFEKNYLKNQKSYFYKFSNLNIGATYTLCNSMEQPVTPQECRIRDLSYSAPIYTNVHFTIHEKFFSRFSLVLCNIPIMLHSKKCILYNKSENFFFSVNECPLDPGGYFIIKGTERAALIQEQLSTNRINIERDTFGNICAVVISCLENRRTKNSVVLKEKKFYFRNNIFLEDISLFIFFKALGFDNDKDIIELIGTDFEDMIELTAYDSKMNGIVSQKQAIFYLNQRLNSNIWKYKDYSNFNRLESFESLKHFLNDVFSKNVLIHLNKNYKNVDIFQEKIVFLSIMTRRILISLDQPNYIDCKDYYGNKRLELSGQLFSVLFEEYFKKAIIEMEKRHFFLQNKSKKKIDLELFSSFRQDIISNGLDYTFSTGNWSIGKFSQEKFGITQILSRLSFVSSLSMINRISSTCEKMRKTSGPRSLHPSQWGMICPSDTPEGESCGLVKNLAILAHITTSQKADGITKLCFDFGVQSYVHFNHGGINSKIDVTKVFLNGNFIGIHYNASKFLFIFRKMRRIGMIGFYVSIFWDTINKSIMISSDSGRICRPLIIVQFGKSKIKSYYGKLIKNGLFFWKNFQRSGLIEFLDTNEQNNALIASNPDKIRFKTTHMEISQEIILGICSSTIPFPDHNQSPRNTYQCAMGKQAVGSISFNQNQRNDTILSLLSYPQKPIVKTQIIELSGNNRLCSGINACVCIMSYNGYDIEDAIILNRSSIERGFFKSTIFKKNKLLLKKDNLKNLENLFENLQYKKKKINAFDKPNSFFFDFKQDFSFLSLIKETIDGKIESLILTSNFQDLFFVKIILRQTRTPEVGDKFSSRHGQKGVCGLISFQENLPFSNEGNIPDLIMNPHGFPSRMTIGKILELVGGKMSSLLGKFTNGTPFNKPNIKMIKKKLIELGFNQNCKDFFYSGITGQPLQMFIFSGPIFYQKLKHMVKDKMHSRSRGPRSCLTRQPVEGRSKGGGLRFGEMERDCLVSYGASDLTIERLMISSDVFFANFDPKTGLMTYENSSVNIVSIKLPYACKLLFQELHSMNIIPRLCIKN